MAPDISVIKCQLVGSLTFSTGCVKLVCVGTPTATPTDREQRIDQIRRAAIPVFATQGFRGTSMADIATAAGVSRPALYQYFDNRADVFRAAFDALLNDWIDAALAALHGDGGPADRFDGYLQRAFGDGYERLASTPHGAEVIEAKYEFAADVAESAHERARAGLRAYLKRSGLRGAVASRVIDLLLLSPVGLKSDAPSPAEYRRRLSALAQAAAALVGTG